MTALFRFLRVTAGQCAARRAVISTAIYGGIYKGTKDFLQPLIVAMALSIPILTQVPLDRRQSYHRFLAEKEEAERRAREEAEARQAALEAEAKAAEEAETVQAAWEAHTESTSAAEEAEEAAFEIPPAVEETAPETDEMQDVEPDQETTDPPSN